MLKFFLIFILSTNLVFASGTTKLIDLMVSESGMMELLGKKGIQGADATQVTNYVQAAIVGLNKRGKPMNKTQLTEALASLPATGKDANIKKELQLLLSKSDSEIKKEDVVKAVNNLVYLANRHGKSVVLTCAECVNGSLAKQGFKFSVENIKNTQTVEVLKNVIPNSPVELNNFIKLRMKNLGMGDYSKVTPNLVSPTEEKSMAVFLQLAESGNKEQKDLIEAIKKISMTDGKVNIIDPKNPHKFWKELSTEMDSKSMKGWTEVLNEVAERREKDGVTAEEAFYRTLKDKADQDPSLAPYYEQIKAKKCFFK